MTRSRTKVPRPGVLVIPSWRAHSILSQVLGTAVEANRLARNVAAGVHGLPRRPEHEMHFLTAVEVERLAAAIDPRFATLVTFAAYTGLRPGELAAEKVKRLDLQRGTAEVAEALGEVNGHLVWGTPKNHERRTVRMPRFLTEQVGAHLAGRPSGPDDLVFTAAKAVPCASTSSWSATSIRPLSGQGCRRPCACTTYAIRPRAC
jgi:integrase